MPTRHHAFEPSANRFLVAILVLVGGNCWAQTENDGAPAEQTPLAVNVSRSEAIAQGVLQLLEIQNEDGAWPYEGVYRVNRKIPVGYRIGGTAICCEALLYGTAIDHAKANRAIEKGVALILKELDDPLMKPSQEDRYDVRVWGHIYALDLFCRLQISKRFPKLKETLEPWIPKLTETLLHEELETGGWNYANRRGHAGFVSAPAVQALLWSKQSGEVIPEPVFKRAAKALLRSRNQTGAFAYSGVDRDNRPAKIQGSIARSANCELTLNLLGLGRQNAIENAIDSFHKHWDELEKRRKKTGTHKPPFGIAPYYFYYGHRYAAAAIQALPKERQRVAFDKLFKALLLTRDQDGTWNDRVFDRSKAYGTAMSVLAILEDKVPLPEPWATHHDLDGVISIKMGPTWHFGPELLVPDVTLLLTAAGRLEFENRSLTIAEVVDWGQEEHSSPKPSVVLLKAHGDTKTRVVEKVKTAITNRFGEFTLFVSVE